MLSRCFRGPVGIHTKSLLKSLGLLFISLRISLCLLYVSRVHYHSISASSHCPCHFKSGLGNSFANGGICNLCTHTCYIFTWFGTWGQQPRSMQSVCLCSIDSMLTIWTSSWCTGWMGTHHSSLVRIKDPVRQKSQCLLSRRPTLQLVQLGPALHPNQLRAVDHKQSQRGATLFGVKLTGSEPFVTFTRAIAAIVSAPVQGIHQI